MMKKLVAKDPATVAEFSDVMQHLFLRHVLGVNLVNGHTNVDGSATEFGRGLFGPVRAYHGPVETQGRGGLHAHYLVWLDHPMTAHVLDQLRRGLLGDALRARLLTWRRSVIEKVASTQFESVERL